MKRPPPPGPGFPVEGKIHSSWQRVNELELRSVNVCTELLTLADVAADQDLRNEHDARPGCMHQELDVRPESTSRNRIANTTCISLELTPSRTEIKSLSSPRCERQIQKKEKKKKTILKIISSVK